MHTWILLPGEQNSWINKAKNLSLAVLPLWWLSSLSFFFYSQTSQIMPYLFKIHWALNTRWPNSRLNRRRWFFSCYKKPGWWLLLMSPRWLTKSGRWHWGSLWLSWSYPPGCQGTDVPRSLCSHPQDQGQVAGITAHSHSLSQEGEDLLINFLRLWPPLPFHWPELGYMTTHAGEKNDS